MEGMSGQNTVQIRFHDKALGLQVTEAVQEELNGQMAIRKARKAKDQRPGEEDLLQGSGHGNK